MAHAPPATAAATSALEVAAAVAGGAGAGRQCICSVNIYKENTETKGFLKHERLFNHENQNGRNSIKMAEESDSVKMHFMKRVACSKIMNKMFCIY